MEHTTPLTATQTHNASPQTNVARNNDPALDVAHEHRHGHLHHNEFSERGRDGEVVYSQGTTFEHSMIPDQAPLDHDLHRRGHPERRANSKDAFAVADAEKGAVGSEEEGYKDHAGVEDPKSHRFSRFYAKYRIYFHLFIFLLFTGWWIASLVLHRHDKNWIIPFLLWLAISLRLFFFHVPITIVTKPMHWTWDRTGVRFAQFIPENWRIPLAGLLCIAVILVGSFASKESEDNTRENRAVSLFGLAVFITVFWATSRDRKRVNWHTVIVGMLIQFVIASVSPALLCT